jgi:methyl-accepting chemotaxis protein
MKGKKFINSLGIRGQLLVGFSAIILILLITVVITLVRINTAEKYDKELISIHIPIYNNTSDLNLAVHELQSTVRSWVLTRDPIFKRELEQIWKSIDKNIGVLFSLLDNNNHYIKDLSEAKILLDQLRGAQIKIMDTMEINVANQMILSDLRPIENKIFTILDGAVDAEGMRTGGLLTDENQKVEEYSRKVIDNITSIEMTEYVLLFLSFIISLMVFSFISRLILSQVSIFRHHSSKIAGGDLTERIAVEGNDELSKLGQDLNSMTDSLVKITKQITQASHNMVTSITEVRSSVNLQSSGATEQAASINEITASLEEIEKSSAQTMEKAKSLGETAQRTREKGKQGLEAIEKNINGMKIIREKVELIAQTILDLSGQTQQVGEITAVVTNLAQQSKMLALNASIEAAKAGEAGKGFAVVAIEVKNLAEQSEQSTTQVQKILEDIRHAAEKAVMVTEEGTKGVDFGMKMIEQTGIIVHDLSEVIDETMIATQQIEAAVRQESVGIEQITIGMNEINQVTSSFVESVKQTTEAIEKMSEIAKDIKKYIDVYKT